MIPEGKELWAEHSLVVWRMMTLGRVQRRYENNTSHLPLNSKVRRFLCIIKRQTLKALRSFPGAL
jgi:hypothetical protein